MEFLASFNELRENIAYPEYITPFFRRIYYHQSFPSQIASSSSLFSNINKKFEGKKSHSSSNNSTCGCKSASYLLLSTAPCGVDSACLTNALSQGVRLIHTPTLFFGLSCTESPYKKICLTSRASQPPKRV